MDFIANKLQEFIEDSGLSYRSNSKSFIFECPRCGKKDKLYIRRSDGRFCCWRCKETDGFKGRAEWALTELTNTPVSVIRRFLYGDDAPDKTTEELLTFDFTDFFDETEIIAEDTQNEVSWPFQYWPIESPQGKAGAKYLESRGVPTPIAQLYGIRYAAPERRVCFPVTQDQRLVGWQARAIFPTEYVDKSGQFQSVPKTLTMRGLKKEQTLMFEDRLVGCNHAVICEGPIDALKAHFCGGNVATMGKAVSLRQMQIIASRVKKVYLALDPDADSELERMCRFFADLEIFLLRPSTGKKDLGECEFAEVLTQFHAAEKIHSGQLFFNITL